MRRNSFDDPEGLPSPRRPPKRGRGANSTRHLIWAVLIIAVLGMISIHWVLRPQSRPQMEKLTAWARGVSILDGVRHPRENSEIPGAWTGRSDEQPRPRDEWRVARHLIVVAGHAVYVGADRTRGALEKEASWSLEPFQKGQLGTMLAHIKLGVKLAAEDNSSLLIFSGGATREAAGPRTEALLHPHRLFTPSVHTSCSHLLFTPRILQALSYWEAAEAQGWFGHQGVRARAHVEDQARGSLENAVHAFLRFTPLFTPPGARLAREPAVLAVRTH